MVSVIKEELRSRIHTLMLRMEAEKDGSKAHTSLVEKLKTHRRKMQEVKTPYYLKCMKYLQCRGGIS
jgi:hypothetical protein